MTCKKEIVKRLESTEKCLAVHEFHIKGYSENNIATRLSELAREGIVKGDYRKDENFKEWSLIPEQGVKEVKEIKVEFDGNGSNGIDCQW